jgi:membrane fusion protein, copper/silver efflux system
MRLLIACIFLCFSANAFAGQPHGGHGETAPPKQNAAAPDEKKSSKPEEARVPVEVPAERQAKIGLKVAKAEKKNVEYAIRTVGTITVDQTREAHVHTKIKGWIERIYADYVGKPVKKNEPLFDLYSPELVATQEEYVAARRQGSIGGEIAASARRRLQLWEVPKAEIERLESSGKANRTVTFNSPADGFIIEKMAIQGMYITPDMELYRIADLSRLWIIITLYEYDVAVIAEGDKAAVSLTYDPDKSFTGTISYVYPEIEEKTRTARARVEVDNPDQRLKPGMFVNVELKKQLGESVVVPSDAVIDTGARSIVFVKSGASLFEPREVKIGPRVDNVFVVLSGLEGGEDVVTSANFLIDAESKFQAAIQKGTPSPAGHGGHGGE